MSGMNRERSQIYRVCARQVRYAQSSAQNGRSVHVLPDLLEDGLGLP
jgi:hypothetical protein